LTRPAGPGWSVIRGEGQAQLPPSPDGIPQMLLGWTAGCICVYAALFGAGSYLYGHTTEAMICTVLFGGSALVLYRLLVRMARISTSRS